MNRDQIVDIKTGQKHAVKNSLWTYFLKERSKCLVCKPSFDIISLLFLTTKKLQVLWEEATYFC